ncbi:aminotransferase A [Salicibibacter halophilus]|uniref:Aminotransferase n=1 Tax=Salicibibacter halophilus TaxID=2502791 RepID=A0A514LE12_9BACI|nr:aminotransferase A [Salicibibacter halophilus]QDI90092.1 aminotransferase A [Salicibibacter halophilus]
MDDLTANINENVLHIQRSGIRQFFDKVATVEGAVQLTLGQPDFQTPEHVKEAAKQAIDDNHTTYTANGGIPELKKAATDFAREKYGLSYDAKREVITTVGASQALDIALRTILSSGDEVLLPVPAYPAYEPLIRLNGAKPTYIDTSKTNFKLTKEAIQAAITPKTRALILSYPSNPTGRVLSEDELQAIAAVLQDENIFVISDEIYSELVYAQVHSSIAFQPGMKARTVVINGLSKSHSMTGWRIGFAFAPTTLTEQMLKVHSYNISCPSSISQHAALSALTVGKDDAERMREEYEKRRDYMLRRLRDMAMPVEQPEGAFYLFPSIQTTGLDSYTFAERLLKEEKLAVVPGTAFSRYGEGYVRLSYAYDMENLTEACYRLERFMHRNAT